MPVFIELTTDAFSTTFNKKSGDAGRQRRAGANRARRPLRGVEIKDDTYAYIKVVQSDGNELHLLDSGAETGRSSQYTNFILQSATEARMEKHQIVETFGEPYIFFFGEQPRFIDYSAVLINSLDFNWEAEWWANYELYLRGTKSVEMGARTYLFYDDTVVEGYMLQAQAQKISEQPLTVQLTFRLYVTNYTNVTFVGDPDYPVRSSINLPPDVSLTNADPFTVASAGVTSAVAAFQASERNAEIAADLQRSGFGGGKMLSDTLRNGSWTNSGQPDIDGVVTNAFQALFKGVEIGRTKPLRGKIADNLDEWTSAPPPQPKGDERFGQGSENPYNKKSLLHKVNNLLGPCGINVANPQAMSGLGMGPNFGGFAGFGAGIGVGVSASFGVSGLAGPTPGYGGVNNGLGFVGGNTGYSTGAGAGFAAGPGGVQSFSGTFSGPIPAGGYNANGQYVGPFGLQRGPTNNPSFNQPVGPNGAPLAANGTVVGATFVPGQGFVSSVGPVPTTPGYNSSNPQVFANGVQVGGGLVSGTGVGGGVSGGVGGFYNSPGQLTPFGSPVSQYTGGPVYLGPNNNFRPEGGFGYSNPSNGAGMQVGGAVSAFAMISVGASLGVGAGSCQPNPSPNALPPPGTSTASALFNVGPNGASSTTNTTGMFAT